MLKIIKIILLLLIYSTINAKDTLVFAPLPIENRKTLFTQFDPMIKYLEGQLDKKIIIDYNKNYSDILEKFKQKKIDIAYLGPLPYIELKKYYSPALPLVHFNNSNGNKFYTCSLVTFATNDITIKNIKNKKIALTQPLSTCGYLSVEALLKESNNSLNHNKYKYIGRHDSVALSIIRGKYDFGGVKSSIAKKYSNLGLKELSKTSLLPSFTLVGNQKTISKKTLQKLVNVLKNTNKEELEKWGENISYGCSAAADEDYDSLRELKNNINIPIKGNF